MIYQLTYTTQRGAGAVVASDDYAALTRRLATIRRPATLRDANGAVLGGCEENDGRCEDRRVRWLWWYEGSSP